MWVVAVVVVSEVVDRIGKAVGQQVMFVGDGEDGNDGRGDAGGGGDSDGVGGVSSDGGCKRQHAWAHSHNNHVFGATRTSRKLSGVKSTKVNVLHVSIRDIAFELPRRATIWNGSTVVI